MTMIIPNPITVITNDRKLLMGAATGKKIAATIAQRITCPREPDCTAIVAPTISPVNRKMIPSRPKLFTRKTAAETNKIPPSSPRANGLLVINPP